MAEHDAVLLTARGAALVVTKRPTPNPGPNEILIDVRSIALNPVDHIQRKLGFNVKSYPKILGSDIAGFVKAVGSNVSADTARVGDRVAAFARSWFAVDNNYGAFQKMVVVPSENIIPLPDAITFNQGSLLPMAVATAWWSFIFCGVARDAQLSSADKKGILVWGVGGSVGSAALQIARSLGFTVYATASQKHHSYLQELGNGPGKVRLFDYKDKEVVAKIIKAVKDDGLQVHQAVEAAAGNMKDILRILNKTNGDASPRPKVAAAPFSLALLWYSRVVPSCLSGASVDFVKIPEDQETTRHLLRGWLAPRLQTGEFVPSPQIQVVPGGLAGIQTGLDLWSKGVSGTKLVVELA